MKQASSQDYSRYRYLSWLMTWLHYKLSKRLNSSQAQASHISLVSQAPPVVPDPARVFCRHIVTGLRFRGSDDRSSISHITWDPNWTWRVWTLATVAHRKQSVSQGPPSDLETQRCSYRPRTSTGWDFHTVLFDRLVLFCRSQYSKLCPQDQYRVHDPCKP